VLPVNFAAYDTEVTILIDVSRCYSFPVTSVQQFYWKLCYGSENQGARARYSY